MKTSIHVGPFELSEPLGRGGMGEVWRGVHLGEGVPVAVKVLHGEHAHSPEYVLAFRREAERLAALDHPAIVTIFDFGVLPPDAERQSEGRLSAGSPYLVMELAPFGALRGGVKLPWTEVQRILGILLDALAHAHARSLIHRDIKPGNVLLSGCTDGSRAEVLLSDFGIAHVNSLEAEMPERELAGTPGFMAPEQVRGDFRELGPWTDLYALGCLAWALLSGEMPFTSETPTQLLYVQLTRELPPLPLHVERPKGLDAWLERMTRVDPRARFRRAADASRALELALQSSSTIFIPAASPVTPAPDPALAATLISVRQVPFVSQPLPPREPPPVLETVKLEFPRTWRTRLHLPRIELTAVGLALYGARELPIADREAERDAIWRELECSYANHGVRFVVLHGASGVGKSRLLRWTMHRVHELGIATPLVATHGPERGPHDGIVPALARHLGCVRLTREALRERIERYLEMHGESDPMEVEGLFGLLAPFACVLGAPRGTDRENSMHALRRALEREARERMVVLGVDDLEWGDETLRFLESIAEGTFDAPLIVIVTMKEEAPGVHPEMRARLEALVDAKHTTRIFVGPLGAEDHLRFVQDLLGLEPTLASDLARRTEGNPLFAEQLVGDWVRRGILEVTRKGFALRAGVNVELPDDIHAVWLARVEQVLMERSASDRAALELGAWLGHRIREDEWRRLCEIAELPPPDSLAAALTHARLAERDIDGTLAFVHGALRESILRRARDAGHRDARATKVEMLLRELIKEGVEHGTERLGRLLAELGRDLEAAELLVRAAEERRRSCDYGLTLGLLSEADACFERKGVHLADARRGPGFIVRAWALRQVGRYTESLSVAEHVLAQAGVSDWNEHVSSALLRRADVDVRLGRVDRGRADLERARDELGARGDLLGIASAEWMLTWIDVFRGELDAPVVQLGRLRALAESPSFPPPGPLHLYWTLGFVHVAREEAELGEHYCRLAEEAAFCFKNRLGLAHARAVASRVAWLRGLDSQAVSLAEDAIAHYRAVGSNEVHFGELALAMALSRLGHNEEADHVANTAAKALERSGRIGFRLRIDTARIPIDAALGRFDIVRARLADASEKRALYSLRETQLARELFRAAEIADDANHPDLGRAARLLALEHLDKPHTKSEHDARLARLSMR